MASAFTRAVARAVVCAVAGLTSVAQAQPLEPSPGWVRAMPSGPDATVKITEEYARLVARDAYFWAWPLINIYNKRLAFSQAPEPGLMNGVLPMAPVNRLAMLRDYVEPEERFVETLTRVGLTPFKTAAYATPGLATAESESLEHA